MIDHAEQKLIQVLAMWGTAAGALIGFFIGALGADPSRTVTALGMLTAIGSLAFVGCLAGYLLGTEVVHGRAGTPAPPLEKLKRNGPAFTDFRK
nr:hypothetical protein [Rhizobium tubonense]